MHKSDYGFYEYKISTPISIIVETLRLSIYTKIRSNFSIKQVGSDTTVGIYTGL